MKKRRILSCLAVPFLLAGCGANANSNPQPTGSSQVEILLTSISFANEDEVVKSYRYGESFVKPEILATYSNGLTVDVTESVSVSGFNSRKLGEQSVTLSYEGKYLTYSVTIYNLLKEISISGQTTSFEVGDDFAFGGIVNAIYDDGTVYNVTESALFNGYDMSVSGTQTVFVSYDGFSTSYEITINEKSEKVVQSISLSNLVEEYKVGDDFVRPTVTATFDDESTLDVSDAASISGYDLSKVGTYEVIVSYKGQSASYSVTVKEKEGNVDDLDPDNDEIEGDFSITTKDGGEVTVEDNVYTITTAGTYSLKGKLTNGQIVVDAEDAEVELSLEGVSISNSNDSPIYIKTADSIDISAKRNTKNYVYDNRSTPSSNEDVKGAGIYCEDGDLKIKGKGTLVVTSLANNGIHGKDDVTIKNATLIVRAVNNGIRGNDSVSIEETPTIDIICGNDGIKTSSSDISSKEKQRGTISITGGTIQINSYADGIDAAYDAVIADTVVEESDGTTSVISPVIDIYTNIYSSYSVTDLSDGALEASILRAWGPGPSSEGNTAKAADSAKGIKACNLIDISGGTTYVKAYDDGIHGNKYSDDELISLENGENATGDVSISGGVVTLNVSDDGVHADGTLNLSGGEVTVEGSYEGLEGTVINVTGGKATVNATNDGINASNSHSSDSCSINISGGYLDVTVDSNGDHDGIDSNGTITINGGTVITRGPNSQNMSPIDADGTIKVEGGTVVVIGRNMSSGNGGWHAPGGGPGGGGGFPGSSSITVGSGVTTTNATTGGSKGNHTITFANSNEVISYYNSYTYSNYVTVYSVNGTATVK